MLTIINCVLCCVFKIYIVGFRCILDWIKNRRFYTHFEQCDKTITMYFPLFLCFLLKEPGCYTDQTKTEAESQKKCPFTGGERYEGSTKDWAGMERKSHPHGKQVLGSQKLVMNKTILCSSIRHLRRAKSVLQATICSMPILGTKW